MTRKEKRPPTFLYGWMTMFDGGVLHVLAYGTGTKNMKATFPNVVKIAHKRRNCRIGFGTTKDFIGSAQYMERNMFGIKSYFHEGDLTQEQARDKLSLLMAERITSTVGERWRSRGSTNIAAPTA